MAFLASEFGRLSLDSPFPYLCTRYLRPLLGFTAAGVEAACEAHGIPFQATHASRPDALAAAKLWTFYRASLYARDLATFDDLTHLDYRYAFMASFDGDLPSPCKPLACQLIPLCPRRHHP